MITKACNCNSSSRRCALKKIKAIETDFKSCSLWRAFMVELHKH